MTRRVWTFFLLLCLAFLSKACESRPITDNSGLAAKVNDRPISLSSLEYEYDARFGYNESVSNPTVEELRSAYHSCLSELIVRELALEELENLGQPVDDADLDKEEARLKAGYPEDEFGKMLAARGIDIKNWRENLRGVLARRKLLHFFAWTETRIMPAEISAYREQHKDELTLPAKLHCVFFYGPEQTKVQEAAAVWRPDDPKFPDRFPGILVSRKTFAENKIPALWANTLQKLPVGKSASLDGAGIFLAVRLLQKEPTGTLSPEQADKLAEHKLRMQRAEDAFTAWQAEALRKARIETNPHLLPKQKAE